MNTNVDQIIDGLNKIPWGQAKLITPAAETLIQAHLNKMQTFFTVRNSEEGIAPCEAYAEAQSAGHRTQGYDDFMDRLFDDVDFCGAQSREHMILAITANQFWSSDPVFGKLENPWTDIVELYGLGYTTSFQEDEPTQSIDLIVGCQAGLMSYTMV